MAPDELRAFAHDLVVRSTRARNLPEKVEDVDTLALVAEVVGGHGD